ncbi:unnamed protein product [Moneuplotes crassus]|uniref:Cyclin N-terminal domain-containing protein n=1 Tax=Euplotes crassus TaxID=5936 RepID=A0AAD1XPA7_EUPCR|nr:unnamed protein product [Moneuplotes crassus]
MESADQCGLRMLKLEEINKNINTYQQISTEMQEDLRIGNCRAIIGMAEVMKDQSKFTQRTMSGAMWLTSYFFYKKSYLNYDRFGICIAALFLCSKIFNEYIATKYYCESYYKIMFVHRGVIPKPLDEKKLKEIDGKLLKNEALLIELLITECKTLPLHEAVESYSLMDSFLQKLFSSDEDELKKVKKAAIFFLNDSFYTVASLVHKPCDVVLACILLGAQTMNVGYPGKKYYDFKKIKLAMSKDKFDKPSKYWYKWVNPEIDMENVNEVVTSISNFYTKISSK